MSKIEELRGELSALTKNRAAIIHEAEKIIRQANRDYDARAFELAREIKRLTPAEPYPHAMDITAPARRKRTVNLTGTDDWTPEEISHYRELAARR